MKTMPVGEFKLKCLGLFRDIQKNHSEIVVTKRGKPVAVILPYKGKETDALKSLYGSVLYENDIVAPTGEPWEADA